MRLIFKVTFGCLILTVALATAGPALAKEENLRKKYALPTHVQLKPFSAPTTSRSGRMTPVTVFLEAFDKKNTGAICRYLPRIMDAIMTHFYQYPIPMKGRSVELMGVADKMLLPINRALGGNWVKSVYILAGMQQMAKGSASRLPFNASGCKGIKDFEEKIKKK